MRTERRSIPRNQSFFETTRIRNQRVLDPVLTSSLWTLLFTIPTVAAAATVNIAFQSKYGILVNFAAIYMVVMYLASALTGIVVGAPLCIFLDRADIQFGFIYLIVGFAVYGLLFVFLSIELHMAFYDYLAAEYGDHFNTYRRAIGGFKYLWLGFSFLGMAIALTGWARLVKE